MANSAAMRRISSDRTFRVLAASALGMALPLIGVLVAQASHSRPTLPLIVPVVESISACQNGAGSTLATDVAKDRVVSGSDNRATDGSTAAIAVWANADSDPRELTLDVPGSHQVINGDVVSRSHLKVSGSWNQFQHLTEYGQRSVADKPAFDLSGQNNCFSPEPAQVLRDSPTAPAGFPLPFSGVFDPNGDGAVLEHFAPGTALALAAMADPAAGAQYFVCGVADPDGIGDQAAIAPGCDQASGKMDRSVQGVELQTGLYYITGEVNLSASNLEATITIVAGRQLKVSGSVQGGRTVFSPYIGDLLFASQWDDSGAGTANTALAEDAVKIEGSLSFFEGVIVATNGRTELAGSQNSFSCPVMGDRVRLNGQLLYLEGGCEPFFE
jgi:hypothetical protein